MKLTIAGVTSSAAQMRSPSFSRSSSSATITNLPARMSRSASSIDVKVIKCHPEERSDEGSAFPPLRPINSDQSLYELADHVRFDVHLVARVQRLERRMAKRVLDE